MFYRVNTSTELQENLKIMFSRVYVFGTENTFLRISRNSEAVACRHDADMMSTYR